MISTNTKLNEALALVDGDDADDKKDYIRSLWEFNQDDYNSKFQENVCPECGTKTLIKDKIGEVYCKKCGLVNERNINRGPDWRSYSYDDEQNLRHAEPKYIVAGKEFFRWTHDLKVHAAILKVVNWDEHTSMCVSEPFAKRLLIIRYNECCVETFKKIPMMNIINVMKFADKHNISEKDAEKCLEASDRYINLQYKKYYLDISRTGIINKRLLSIILSSEEKLAVISSLQKIRTIKAATYGCLTGYITPEILHKLEKYGIIIQTKIPKIKYFYYFHENFW